MQNIKKSIQENFSTMDYEKIIEKFTSFHKDLKINSKHFKVCLPDNFEVT